MSDTPRTHAFLDKEHVAWDGMWVTFAKELERENITLRALLAAWVEYSKLLSAELEDVIGIAVVHGWASNRVASGQALRAKIAELEKAIKP